MAIPLSYNLRSLRVRWTSSIVTVLGIAGSVGVFVAMLSLARGFQATLVASGSAENAIVRRAGATSEIDSSVQLDRVRVLSELPGVAREAAGPLVSPEVVVIAGFPMLESPDANANVQVRGVAANVLQVRTSVKMLSGRFFQPGLSEMVVGRNVPATYVGLQLGSRVPLGGETWTVVGVFDAGGSAFDSEVWADANVLNQVFQRPQNLFQSVTLRLDSPGALTQFKDAATTDPRLNVQVEREVDYYAKQSQMLTTLITVLGTLVAVVMGIGAVFGSLNTMYSAVAERSREVATMRAIGFAAPSIVASFMFESLCIALVGGLLGCLAVLPLNGLTTGAMNWQTFSHLAFAFRITPGLLGVGMAFALLMGLLGGVPPAMRAARGQVASALREL
ncbi:MAG: ABC transporter permease [Candidatus Korobacteraceae bacterium]